MEREADFVSRRGRMVDELKLRGYVITGEVERAFSKVPRENFITEDQLNMAYADTPLPILCGQTISAPSMIAIMLESARFARGLKVLEVGTGSGYNAALISELVGAENVVSIERHRDLARFGEDNLKRQGYDVKVVLGDGSQGYEPDMPYDRVFATAGAPRIPNSWVRQCKVGGMIIAPVGPGTFSQRLFIAEKVAEGKLKITKDTYCAFVPLIGKEAWRDDEEDRGVV